MPIEPEILRSLPLFKGLTPELYLYVSEHGRKRAHRIGDAIVRKEDPGETFYMILQGTAKVSTTFSDGKEVFLALLATGDTFGEMSLIDQSARAADVITQEPTTLIVLDRTTFNHLMDSGSVFARNLLQILARRLRLANVRIQALATLDVYGLVARQILEFADLYGQPQPNGDVLIPIRLTQTNMAELVGASRERVNQVMVAYRQKEYITVDAAYHITVHLPEDLKRRCQ